MARDVGNEKAGAFDPQTDALVYVSDDDPGIIREGEGPGVFYRDPQGEVIAEGAALERIRALAIPPAWSQVWICPLPGGHIQAVGRDARGRKQYRYHYLWRAFRDEAKFERVHAFGRALPRLRARVEADLSRRGLCRERVLAGAVRLLELTLLRIGNAEYAKCNQSFGLTTLRKRHVALSGAGAVFEFRAKSGILRRTGFQDRRLARLLRTCESLPGQRLFQYVDAEGERHQIESGDVNAYIREAMGEDFSAKDFRTWAASLAAARALSAESPPTSEAAAKRAIVRTVKATAGLLGNTAAVCRSAYIHPIVIEAFRSGALGGRELGEGRRGEAQLLRLIDKAARA
ncbi:MAG: DNA topoisomerase IB [Caulobacteraceae bacterium]